MWLFYALLAGALYTAGGLLTRHVLRGQKDAWAYSFYFSLAGTVICLPLVLLNPTIPTEWRVWLVAIVTGFLIIVYNLLAFKGANYIEASLSGAIAKFKLIWVFVLSIVTLQAVFSWPVLAGTLLTIAGGLVIMHKFRQPKSLTGIWFVFASTIFYAIIIVLFKYLFHYFNAVSMAFFVTFLIPLFLNFAIMPRASKRIGKMFREDGYVVSFATAIGASASLAMNQSLSLGSASAVLVTIESFLVLTLVGEHIFLKEKENLWVKIIAVILAVAGAVLIRLSS